MSELMNTLYDKHYDTPDLFPERDLLESLRPQQLEDFIGDCFAKKQELDRLIKLAIDVKEGGYGV